MIRRIQLSLRPSEALAALTSLHAPPGDVSASPGASSAAAVFGQRLGQEVARAFDAHARALDVLGQCLDWLERRGLCDVSRPRARAGVREPTWRAEADVKVDVRALVRDLVAERDDPDSKARASAWATRAVLRHLAGTSLHACEVRVGSERIPAAEALAAYDTELSLVGYGPHAAPPARLAHLAKGARRKDDPSEAPPPVVKVEAVKVEAAARVTKVKPVEAAAPKVDAASPKVEAAPKVETKRPRTKEKPFGGGFGGLPDDAAPEDRRAGDVFSTRGLTLDAEFFLTEAAIAVWPCDAASLERGRRAVVTRLHPDRAGEASALAFHRAIKGHADLVKKLPTTPVAPAATTPPAPVVASATVSAVVEVTPPAAVTKPARRPRPRAPRDATTPATATATTFEWPPRPVDADVPRAKTA
jgi:hypothetical protein